MYLSSLVIDGLRCIQGLDLQLGPGLHVFTGANGSGKTSILEAVALLGSGRSFRSAGSDVLITRGKDVLNVFAEVSRERHGREVEHVALDESPQRLGFQRQGKQWRARINGVEVQQLSELVRLVPVWVLEPNSHELIFGGSEPRRALLDWLLFHVEPNFARISARYRHVLKQRNALLKQESVAQELAVWDTLLIESGMELTAIRERHLPSWLHQLATFAQRLLPELGDVQVLFKNGFPTEVAPFDALQQRLPRDLALGYTSIGPHRADWSLSFAAAPGREYLSRGQSKNSCFAAVLATLACFAGIRGETAILCLDDLFSELDEAHQALCLRYAAEVARQVLVTGVQSSPAVSAWPGEVHHIAL